MRHLHIDPYNGIAGDMLLSALVHAGAPPGPIQDMLNRTSFPGVASVALSFPEVSSHGVQGRTLRIDVSPAPPHGHRSYSVLREILGQAPIPPFARAKALAVLERLGRAEAAVHGVALEEVHFHELGGYDTVIDLAGVALALDLLNVGSISCGPIPLTRGRIRCEHGLLPSPAPATLHLLTGVPVQGLDLDCEVVTPTGAALAVTLASDFSPAPLMTLTGAGAGFGTSVFPDRPNCLRVILGETAGAGLETEVLWLLETNLDDLSPEVLATLPERCLEAGALDSWLLPILMKKGRPAHLLQALCSDQARRQVENAIFRHSSALGIRRRAIERDSLARTWETVSTPWGPVRVKIGWLDGQAVNRAPEFEDCRQAADRGGVPLKLVYAAALGAAHNP